MGRVSFLFVFFALIHIVLSKTFEIIPVGTLPTGRGYASSVFDGKETVFLIGGEGDRDEHYRDVLAFNVKTNTYKDVSTYPFGVANAAAAAGEDGECYHFGGFSNEYNDESGIYTFSSENPHPKKVGDLLAPDSYISAAPDGQGSVYIAGSRNSDDGIYKFNSSTGKVELVGNAPRATTGLGLACIGDSLYGFGGTVSENQIFKFSPATAPITVLDTKIVNGAWYSSAVAVGEEVYIVGGYNNLSKFRLSKFDTRTEELVDYEVNYSVEVATPSAQYIRSTHRIYIFGGHNNSDRYNNIFYIQL